MDRIRESAREVKVVAELDVVVCGGGPAGVCAALASARRGAKTCLIESSGCLGGTWTAGLMGWIIDQQGKGGILKEIIDGLRLSGGSAERAPGCGSFPFDIEAMKLLLERKCVEAGVRVRLHTRGAGVVKGPSGRIEALLTESKSGREAWRGKLFVDGSGDGDLGAWAGCSFQMGNPDSGLTQPMSLLCLLGGLDLEEVKERVNGYGEWGASKALLKAEMERGGISPSYAFPTLFHLCDGLYMLMANHQYKVRSTDADDLSRATMEARAEIHRQVAALRSLGGPWRGLRLLATAEHIGMREGRRIKGLYEVRVEDAANGARHEDAVCRVNFGLDVHATDPAKGKGIEKPALKAQPYDIPLRALISAEVPNLLMAGRCVSGDFLAHSSYRVTGNAAPIGEAAGALAATAALGGRDAAKIPFKELEIPKT